MGWREGQISPDVRTRAGGLFKSLVAGCESVGSIVVRCEVATSIEVSRTEALAPSPWRSARGHVSGMPSLGDWGTRPSPSYPQPWERVARQPAEHPPRGVQAIRLASWIGD